MLRKTYAEINLSNISHNISELKRAAGTNVMAVVKADAYGHGMFAVAQRSLQEGVNWFAVATPDEAIALREIGGVKILLLSPALPCTYETLVDAQISICVTRPEEVGALAECAAKLGKNALTHLKLDTGMGRVGLRTVQELDAIIGAFRAHPNVIMEGLFTHFAAADEADPAYTNKQSEKFSFFSEKIKSAGFSPLLHTSNSAATIRFPELHLDLCRMGISMYGYFPSHEVDWKGVSLKPAMSLISYVSHLKYIEPGESVSYGCKFTAEKRTKIATVPIGYADGYKRALSCQASALVNGKLAKLVGRVCMDQIMLDTTDIPVSVGDEVVLMGTRGDTSITADDLATLALTISYEILTSITARIPRVYL